MDNDSLISNVKQKDISYTHYGNSIYSDLWYCDNTNKICITFTPRGGCTISFHQFLELVGLLDDGLQYSITSPTAIHGYRVDIMLQNIKKINIHELIKNNYTFIKFIMNPYIRAVSIFRFVTHNLSFREYLKEIINNKTNYKNLDTYHSGLQYIDGEEKIIKKYIKIDKYETYQVKLADNSLYTFDVNKFSKFTTTHHGTKTDNTSFCGDEPKDVVNKKLPKSYKYFYDDEIKKMVETIYEKDIKHYGYDFDDFD